MIVWSGWGILVVPIVAVVGGAVGFAVVGLLTAAGLEGWAALGPAVGGLAAAAVIWWAGRRLNGTPGRVLLDPATGQRVVLRRSHSLFFMPMQWWSVPVALVSAGLLLAVLFFSPVPGALTPAGTRASTGSPSTGISAP